MCIYLQSLAFLQSVYAIPRQFLKAARKGHLYCQTKRRSHKVDFRESDFRELCEM